MLSETGLLACIARLVTSWIRTTCGAECEPSKPLASAQYFFVTFNKYFLRGALVWQVPRSPAPKLRATPPAASAGAQDQVRD